MIKAKLCLPLGAKIDFKLITFQLILLRWTKINFKLICNKEKIIIEGDEEQLNLVFINLVKNSIESINDKLKKNIEFTQKIDIEIKEKNNYIYCIIDDNGVGFSEENLNKIVKPYFTTKVKGTGLGLAIVNKVVNDHDGKIYFRRKNNGATVEVILPKNVS